MIYICQHCKSNLDEGDILEHFMSIYVDINKAKEIARLYGWTEINKKHFDRSIIVQSNDGLSQYTICPDCKNKDPLINK